MKRFLIFAFDRFYPDGGMRDLKASVETIEEASEKKEHLLCSLDKCQIYDLETGLWTEFYAEEPKRSFPAKVCSPDKYGPFQLPTSKDEESWP